MKCFFQCIACSFFDPSIEGCFTLYLIFITFKSFYNIRLYFSNIKSTIQSNCICKKKNTISSQIHMIISGMLFSYFKYAKSVCLFFWDKIKRKRAYQVMDQTRITVCALICRHHIAVYLHTFELSSTLWHRWQSLSFISTQINNSHCKSLSVWTKLKAASWLEW